MGDEMMKDEEAGLLAKLEAFDEFAYDADICVEDGDVVLVTNTGFRVRVIDDPGALVACLETAIALAALQVGGA